eukprot:scaffold5505_cov129-Isochrysis_galbana.AAC.1
MTIEPTHTPGGAACSEARNNRQRCSAGTRGAKRDVVKIGRGLPHRSSASVQSVFSILVSPPFGPLSTAPVKYALVRSALVRSALVKSAISRLHCAMLAS